VRLLLDTHVVLWTVGGARRISAEARERMSDPTSEVFVSSATVWEAAIKFGTGKLPLPDNFVEAVAAAGMRELPVTSRHGFAAGRLPRHHGDAFDRMLVAQAQLEGLTLVTRDAHLAAYGVPILPA
jgi:PIN domain nuclease of toxin-antitoxin system